MSDDAFVHARWHRALDDPEGERLGPIRDHIAAHDAEVAARTLREAADRLTARVPIVVNGLAANATRREWSAAWLRARADTLAAPHAREVEG